MNQIQLTKQEKRDFGTTEISKLIKQQIKKEFPNCKFSVSSSYYSMGSSISIYLMESNIKTIKNFEDISEEVLLDYENRNYSKEQIKELQNKGNHQLNPYSLREDFKEDNWCNGVFLTEEGFKLLKRIVEISDYYNYDESDSQTDYYSVNFSFNIGLGKWNKEFKEDLIKPKGL